MNRYYQSNLVYGMANGLDLKWLLNLDARLPKEDFVILLDVRSKDSFARKSSRRDKFEENKKFAKKIISNYRALAKKFSWKIVNASQSQDKVHNSIKDIVFQRLK